MVNTNGLVDERPANETISRWRLHSGQVMPRFFGTDPSLSRPWYSGIPRLDALNESAPFRPDCGLLLWRDS